MDNLFFAIWKRPGRKEQRQEDFWLDPPASGFGRLLAAVAIVSAAAWLLDHVAAARAGADSVVASPYRLPEQGSSK
ncbi:hypothetical protein SAMN03159463_01800 [Mesorhizobium sp. NFR06]|uniref:hypothetical protein n=1 Tax=Mesorhizobium sp. NFR06 TaxID=1566290 RepID=UPI0008DFB965|nr:hypothetical protein [Mesorhizobium sp. NFR06]SFO41446.1 hypothetical protein SAMN03159463_01800 [Mesorhizobium sp. NFR06]